MAYFSTSKVEDNEVVKASDINFGFEAQIDNVGKALQLALESNQDFVIGGKVAAYNGMNVSIAPIFGVCYSNSDYFGNTETLYPVAVTPSSNKDRIDIVEIESAEETYDEQQRAFNDFETEIKTYKNIDTKKRRILNVVVKMGEPGAAVAPTTTEGRVKIAEIHVGANVTELTDDDIYNITSDVAGLENSEWTTEKDKTYNIGYISDVNARFREEHNKDGSHKENIIGTEELNSGTGDKQVNAGSFPINQDVSISGNTVSAGTSIQAMINTIAAKVNDLFNKYLINGAFNFKGELALSDVDADNVLTKAIKIGAAGDGTGYIKVANTVVLSITADGRIQTNGTTATADNDIVTKAVTDGLNSLVSGIDERLTTLESTVGDISAFANGVLSTSRYAVDSSTISYATTANVTLSGSQSIDGKTPSDGNYILVKNQTDAKQNGIYQYSSSSAWSRVSSFSSPSSLKGKLFHITSGNSNGGKLFYMTNQTFTKASEFGSDNINFVEHIAAKSNVANHVVMRDSNGDINVRKVNGYTLAGASEKGVDTSISANTTSTNLPTSSAVEARINAHSGIDKVGTVTSIKMNGSSKTPSNGEVDLGTIITSTFSTLADGAVPKSGANTDKYLRGDGTWATPPDTDTWRPLGTGANDACAGNDSRLSNAREANGGNSSTVGGVGISTAATIAANALVPIAACSLGTTSGYIKLANGLLIQWLKTADGSSWRQIDFADYNLLSYSSTNYLVFGTMVGNGYADANCMTNILSASSCRVDSSNSGCKPSFFVLTIGKV